MKCLLLHHHTMACHYCLPLVPLHFLFFFSCAKQRIFPEMSHLAWLQCKISLCGSLHGTELTSKAARESDNFIWNSMCWDKVPVRILFLWGEQSLHIRNEQWDTLHSTVPGRMGQLLSPSAQTWCAGDTQVRQGIAILQDPASTLSSLVMVIKWVFLKIL